MPEFPLIRYPDGDASGSLLLLPRLTFTLAPLVIAQNRTGGQPDDLRTAFSVVGTLEGRDGGTDPWSFVFRDAVAAHGTATVGFLRDVDSEIGSGLAANVKLRLRAD